MVPFNAAKFVWLEYNDEKPWDHLLDSIGALCGFPTDRGNRSNATWRDVARRGGVEEDLMTGHVLGGTTVDPEGNGVIMPFLRWKLGLILARTGILHAYDRFVITRCDYFFECNLNVRKLDKRSIWVPFHKIWLTQEADAKSWSSLKHVQPKEGRKRKELAPQEIKGRNWQKRHDWDNLWLS